MKLLNADDLVLIAYGIEVLIETVKRQDFNTKFDTY